MILKAKTLKIRKPKLKKDYSSSHTSLHWEKVKSLAEKVIADILFKNKIFYQYEPKICKVVNWKPIIIANPDFFLRKQNVYMEYFGLNSKKTYKQNWNDKRKKYKENNIPCIYLNTSDVYTKKNGKYIVKTDTVIFNNITKKLNEFRHKHR